MSETRTYKIRRAFVVPMGLLVVLTITLLTISIVQGQPVGKIVILAGLILPLFALFSAGVAFSPENLEGFPTGVSLGVIAGLVLGKPVGVLATSWLVMRFADVNMGQVTLSQLLGAGFLAGIGHIRHDFANQFFLARFVRRLIASHEAAQQ